MLIQLDDRPDYTPPAKPDKATMTVVNRPIGTSVPTNWRGVFDAIDAGNWAAAQAGIAALPGASSRRSPSRSSTPSRNSPVVDLNSIQSLMAQAPDIPEANQLALMAIKRGAVTSPMVVPEQATVNLGSAPIRYRARPVQGEPAANQLRAASIR